MNISGGLRHSKTHRAAVLKQWSKQMVRYEVTMPPRWLAGMKTEDTRLILNLPAGAVVQSTKLIDYENKCRLVVDAPRSAHLVGSVDVQVVFLGPAPKEPNGRPRPPIDRSIMFKKPLRNVWAV